MERYNIIVVGAGSGGLVVAAGAAGMGARVALIEKGKMGGDCLNYGCVPSKALLKAAKVVQAAREAPRYGLRGIADPGHQDARAVMDYVRSCQARIAPHDSVERFRGLGVEVYQGAGRLRSAHEVHVEGAGVTLWGRHVVLATGSGPFIPEIPGLQEAGYLTNETVWEMEKLPRSLIVIGGGPIGTELGQAFARLGSHVTLASSSSHILPREDPDVAEVLAAKLRREGMTLLEGARVSSISTRDGENLVTVQGRESTREVPADEILVAAGRTPHLDGLGLEAVGVALEGRFVKTDAACRTSVPSVWAIGDAAGRFLFTHWASYQARVILRNVLFPGTVKCDFENMPWTTFTEPEVAHVGLNESSARRKGIPHTMFKVPFGGNDRAVCDGEHEDYFAKVVAGKRGKILGATIVHPHAGDLLAELVLAKRKGLTLSDLSATIHTYPSLSEINRALGDAYVRTKLTPMARKILSKLFRWTRR